MDWLDLVLVAAVAVGISIQAAIGFGFAFIVAPAAFAVFEPARAVTFVLLISIAINVLVLYAEGRAREVAGGPVTVMLVASVPGVIAGAWLVVHADRSVLQALVGAIVLGGAGYLWLRAQREAAAARRSPAIEGAGGLAAGALTTSVSVNGPAVLLVLTRLGLRGHALRDSIAAALLGLDLIAAPALLIGSGASTALPLEWVTVACIPALLVGHRFGARVFERLDAGTHHRIALVAAGVAGALSLAAGLAS